MPRRLLSKIKSKIAKAGRRDKYFHIWLCRGASIQDKVKDIKRPALRQMKIAVSGSWFSAVGGVWT